MGRFIKGDRITSINDIIFNIKEKRWMYFKDRPLRPQWFNNMSLMTLTQMIKKRNVYEALDTSED
jgi:uncharacterized protein YrrD